MTDDKLSSEFSVPPSERTPNWRPTPDEVKAALRAWYAYTDYDEKKCSIGANAIDVLRRRIIDLEETP